MIIMAGLLKAETWIHFKIQGFRILSKINLKIVSGVVVLVLVPGASICFQHWANFFLYWLEKVEFVNIGRTFQVLQ